MPISLDDAFAGAVGREFGAGPSMADQFDRLGRALERRRDPLTRIGLDTFDAIRDMAGQLREPPWYVLATRVVNLGFLELMAGGSFVFLILIYLKLDAIWRRIGGTNLRLDKLTDVMVACHAELTAIAACVCSLIPSLLGQVIGLLGAILVTLSAYLAAVAQITIKYVVDIGPNLAALDLTALILQLTAVNALLGALSLAASATTGLLTALAAAATLAAGALALMSAALNSMPDNAAEIIAWLFGLVLALTAFVAVAGLLGLTGKGLIGIIVGFAGAILLLTAIAIALNYMPENVMEISIALVLLIAALGGLVFALSRIKKNQITQVVAGLIGLGLFLILTAAAFRIFDETAVQAMQSMPQLLDALKSLADYIKDLTDAQMEQIAKGLLGIAAFVFLLGLALRVFPDDAAPALSAMSQVLAEMRAIAQTILGLDPGQMEQVRNGLIGIVLFVAALGVALWLFGEQSIQAATALGQLLGPMASLIVSLTLLNGLNIWTLIAVFAGLSVVLLAVGAAANLGGPHLSSLAAVLRELSGLINTVVANAGRLATALRSLPSISLPSLPGLPGLRLPGMADGGPIDRTGPYLLHEGEYVLNPADTRAMRAGEGGAAIAASNSVSVGAVNITISAQSVDEEAVPALGDEIVRQIANRLAELSRDDAFAQGVRTETG